MKENLTKKFGSATAMAMVVGIVIGIGIYFRTPGLMVAIQNNTLLGLFVWIFGGLLTLFCALTIAEYASHLTTTGGDLTYMEHAGGNTAATILGWGNVVVGRPAITAIFAWVGAEFLTYALGLDTKMWQLPLAFIFLTVTFAVNIVKPRAGGKYQVIMTIIKIVPLALLILFGLFNGGGHISQLTDSISIQPGSNIVLMFFSALVPVVFAFDGWMVAATMSTEIDNPKKNLPRALIGGIAFVSLVYALLYLGFVNTFPAAELGETVPFGVAGKLFGERGAQFIMLGITISALGALNGFSVACIRTPYSVALRKLMIFSDVFSKVNDKTNTPIASGVLMYGLTLVFLLCNYFLGAQGDFSAIASAITLVLYTVIYFGVIKLRRENKGKEEFKDSFRTPLFPLIPILAIVTSLTLLVGLFFTDAATTRNVLIAIVVYFIGIPLYFVEKKRLAKKGL